MDQALSTISSGIYINFYIFLMGNLKYIFIFCILNDIIKYIFYLKKQNLKHTNYIIQNICFIYSKLFIVKYKNQCKCRLKL